MKIVLNRCFGGFGLSDKAIKSCISRGMTVTTYSKEGELKSKEADFVKLPRDKKGKGFFKDNEFYTNKNSDKDFRVNPILIEVIEKLGESANAQCAELEIIDIPFTDCDGWEITEYDGKERVEENHSSW